MTMRCNVNATVVGSKYVTCVMCQSLSHEGKHVMYQYQCHATKPITTMYPIVVRP